MQQVIARYAFNSSSIALQELQWHIFGAIFLLGTARALNQNSHVRVDFLATHFSEKVRLRIELAGVALLLLPLCCLVIWYGYFFASSALEFQNPHGPDYYSKAWREHVLYPILSKLELQLRRSILIGEISPDPGGLEARWIIKMLIPLSFLQLALQATLKFAADLIRLRSLQRE